MVFFYIIPRMEYIIAFVINKQQFYIILFVMKHKEKMNFSERFQKTHHKQKFKLIPKIKTQLAQTKLSILEKKTFFLNDYKKSPKHSRFMSELSNIENDLIKQQTRNNIKQWHSNERSSIISPKQTTTKHIQTENTKIFQQYIQNVKHRNKKDHRKGITFSLLSFNLKGINSRMAQLKEPMQKGKYAECCNIINILFRKLKNLKEIGYSDAKINQWILSFCETSKHYFKQIFMKNKNKSVYNLNEHFQYQKDQRIIQQKIRYKIQKKKDNYSFIEVQQLRQFATYIEQILILKNNTKIQKIQSSILQNMSDDLLKKLKSKDFIFNRECLQINNFTNELNLYQKKYGPFRQFSKINKKRYEKLNEIQTNIKGHYHDFMNDDVKRMGNERDYINSITTTI